MKFNKRKMIRIDEDLGQLIRVGSGLDTNSIIDIGSLLSMDFDEGELSIRSFFTGNIRTFEMSRTNSSVVENPEIKIMENKFSTGRGKSIVNIKWNRNWSGNRK